jgi:hypothetical protein
LPVVRNVADIPRDRVQDVARGLELTRLLGAVHIALAQADAHRHVRDADLGGAGQIRLARLRKQVLPALREISAGKEARIVPLDRVDRDRHTELVLERLCDLAWLVVGGEA